MSRRLHVTVLVDPAMVPRGDPTFARPPRRLACAEYAVTGALRELGHAVRVLPTPDTAALLVAELERAPRDVVFNLTELFGVERRFDMHIAAFLELTGVPFTGSRAQGLMLSRDKSLSKLVLAANGIDVPRHAVVQVGDTVGAAPLALPLVVKPLLRDGSDGISNKSLVRTQAQYRTHVRRLLERYAEPVIVEEFIEGREVYVGVIGGSRPQPLPPRELFVGARGPGAPILATYRLKWNERYRARWRVRFGDSTLGVQSARDVARVSLRAFMLLGLRGYARVDMRITPEGRVVVLEANANPNLARWCDLGQSALRAGISYEHLIERILRDSMR